MIGKRDNSSCSIRRRREHIYHPWNNTPSTTGAYENSTVAAGPEIIATVLDASSRTEFVAIVTSTTVPGAPPTVFTTTFYPSFSGSGGDFPKPQATSGLSVLGASSAAVVSQTSTLSTTSLSSFTQGSSDPARSQPSMSSNNGATSMHQSSANNSGFRTSASPTPVNGTCLQPAKAAHGVSSGTLAGTAIACLLLGAAVAGLLAWAIFAYRRKHNRRPSHAGVHSEAASSSNEEHKYEPLVPVPIRPSEQAARPDPGATPLPPPNLASAITISTTTGKRISVISVNALDKVLSVLRTQVKTLFEQVEMHVDNFYYASNNGLPLLTPGQQQCIQELDTPYLEDSVAGVLPQAQYPRTLIKHCLAHMIVSGIDFTSGESRSHPLLPSDMMSLYQTISATASEQQQRHWRNDTMALIGSDAIVSIVDTSAIARRFTNSFSPWASETYSPEARVSHLTKVIKDAVELGAGIFGRPGDFKWHWQNRARSDSNSSSKTLVVFPGLSMVTTTQYLVSFSEQNSDPAGKKRFEVVAPFIAGL